MSGIVTRVFSWIIAFVIGGFYGAAATIAHSVTLGWFPIGIVLAAIGSAALLIAVRTLVSDSWAPLATGFGMLAMTLLLSGRGPGGSVLMPQSPLALAWTITMPLIVLIVVAWPKTRRLRGSSGARAVPAQRSRRRLDS